MHHLTHLQVALRKSGERVQEVVRGGGFGDPNSSHARAHTRFHPCITNHEREPSSNRRRLSRQHSAYSVAAALLIFIAAPGGRGRGLRAPLRNSGAPAAAGRALPLTCQAAGNSSSQHGQTSEAFSSGGLCQVLLLGKRAGIWLRWVCVDPVWTQKVLLVALAQL